MPAVTVEVPHKLDPQEVIDKAKPVLEKTIEDFEGHDLDMQWTDNRADFSFKSLAFTIKGNIVVEADKMTVTIELPFAAMMFKGKIEEGIRSELTRMLKFNVLSFQAPSILLTLSL